MNKSLSKYYERIRNNLVSFVPFSRKALELLQERCEQDLDAQKMNMCEFSWSSK